MDTPKINLKLALSGCAITFIVTAFLTPQLQAMMVSWERYVWLRSGGRAGGSIFLGVLSVFLVGILSSFIWPIFRIYVSKLKRSGVSWGWPFLISYGIGSAFVIRSFFIIIEVIDRVRYEIVLFVALNALIGAVFMFFVLWSQYSAGSAEDQQFSDRDFAPGAVGLNQDGLGFKQSARGFARMLTSLRSYVSVVGLQGGMGYGKSSYLRMTMESLASDEAGADIIISPQESLYTYISLTETNKAEDFSALFAKKWKRTLAERYPVTSIAPVLSAVEPLVGSVQGSDFFKGIFTKTLDKLDEESALYPTMTKVSDSFLNSRNVSVDQAVAGMFFYIPRIMEKRWVIVIDELERAPLDELFRLAETIERLKNVGRTGLPVRVIFILCFSREDLQERLMDTVSYPNVKSSGGTNGMSSINTDLSNERVDSSNSQKRILYDFFFFQKTLTHLEWIPPIHEHKRMELAMLMLATGLGSLRMKPDLPFDGEVEWKNDGATDRDSSFIEDADVVANFISLVKDESARFLIRVIGQVQNVYLKASRLKSPDSFDPNAIRIGDILMAEYLRLKYPVAIDEMLKSIDKLAATTDWMNAIRDKFPKGTFYRSNLELVLTCSFNPHGLRRDVTGGKSYSRSLCNPDILKTFLMGGWPDSKPEFKRTQS